MARQKEVITQHISRSIRINASAEHVFTTLIDWPSQSKWIFATKVHALTHEGTGVGGTILARTSIGPIGFDDPMIMTHWQPPLRFTVLHTGHVVKGSGSFIVESISPDTSTFTWAEETVVPFGFLGTIGWHLIKLPVGLTMSWSLRKFKKWIEPV